MQKNKQGILLLKIAKVICSGLLGVILTIAYQHFFAKPTYFTFVYNGDEIQVTETDYVEIINENTKLNSEILSLQQSNEDLLNNTETLEEIVDSLKRELLSSYSDNSDMELQMNEILNAQQSNDMLNRVIEQATTYWENNDYIQALAVLKNEDVHSDEINTLYVDYSNRYVSILLNQAEIFISERKYDEAVSLLTNALPLVSNTTALRSKIDEIGNHAPQKLSKLKITSSRYVSKQEDKSFVDTVGNTYSPGNLFTISAYYDTYGYASFYLGKQFISLSGLIAVADQSADKGYSGWLELYSVIGDEYTQIYKSPLLSRMTEPISLDDVDISGAEWIEIRFVNNTRNWNDLVILVADMILYSL